jgi:hypothetical protein
MTTMHIGNEGQGHATNIVGWPVEPTMGVLKPNKPDGSICLMQRSNCFSVERLETNP